MFVPAYEHRGYTHPYGSSVSVLKAVISTELKSSSVVDKVVACAQPGFQQCSWDPFGRASVPLSFHSVHSRVGVDGRAQPLGEWLGSSFDCLVEMCGGPGLKEKEGGPPSSRGVSGLGMQVDTRTQ